MEKTESKFLEWINNIRTRLRLVRLQFVQMEIPEDAKTPEQMLDEIKKKISERA